MTSWETPEERAARNVSDAIRWSVAGVSFSIVLVLFLFMDFGDRGFHFETSRQVASNLSSTDADGYELQRLRVLTRCVGYVRSNYVDASRADARQMVISALDGVEQKVPEFMSRPILTEDGEPAQVAVRVGDDERVFELDRVSDLYTMNWKLLDIFEFVAPLLSGGVQPQHVEYAAVNGMLRTLDPHSILLTPSVYREMKLGTTGKFGGLGIVIGLHEGHIMVQSVLDGTPAKRAGLKSGDKIVQIGGESTLNMALNDAVQRLRGPPGTPVNIWVARRTFTEPRKFRIVRSNITLASVSSELLDDGVGHIRIKSFHQSTASDLAEALETMDAQSRQRFGTSLKGVLLDLRDNPGGLLDQAIEVSDLFLDDGVIVTTVGSGNKVREERLASSGGTWRDLPVVVLVNSGSASASEIVAGALRNQERAILVGFRTFGKGSVQVIYDIDDSALKLTIAQYLTPGDESIQSVGIMPHVELVPAVVSPQRVHLNVHRNGGERSLKNHLVNGERIREYEADARVSYVAGSDEEQTDFSVELGRRIVSAASGGNALEMLARAAPLLERARQEQTARLVESLGALDVDWNQGTTPEESSLSAELTSDPDTGEIQAGEKITLNLHVTNHGSEPIHRLRAFTESPVDLFDGLDFPLGRVPPGETRHWTVKVDVPKQTETQRLLVEAKLYVDNSETPLAGAPVASMNINIQRLGRPRFAYTVQIDDSEHGNGDGVANVGEHLTLRVRIQNIGSAPGQRTLAVLRNRGGEEAFITEGRVWMDGLEPGASSEAAFQVSVRQVVPEGGLQLEIQITDTVLRHRFSHTLPLAFESDVGPEVLRRSARWRTDVESTRVYGGASRESQPLGALAPDTAIYSNGSVDGWVRVPMEENQVGWIERDKVEPASDEDEVPQRLHLEYVPATRQPELELSALVLTTDQARLEIQGNALFPTLPAGHRPEVYVFRNRDKVFFTRLMREEAPFEFTADITLEDGRNELTVYTRAGPDLMVKRRLYVNFER